MITVKKITAEDCYLIRQKVLWQHKELSDCGIDIDQEEGAFHLGAYLEGKLLSIASFFVQKNNKLPDKPQYRLRAMASMPEAQNKGCARALLAFAFKELDERKQSLLWCDAREVAIGFYEKLGFQKIGQPYEIPIIGTHYLMVKPIGEKPSFTEAEWKQILSPLAFDVLRNKGTEAPFTGSYIKYFKKGVYTCVACNKILFNSDSKFDSSCGWPAFDKALPSNVEEKADDSHGMHRTEIICSNCQSHLGHVFNDGPTSTGLRYCVNSVCLTFKLEV